MHTILLCSEKRIDMKDKKLKRLAAFCLLVGAAGTGLAFTQGIKAGCFAAASTLLLMAAFAIFLYSRYKEIGRVSAYLTALINGAELMDLRDNEEGELSILKNNIYKTAKKLRTQTELLYKDKNWLSDALADVSHQLKTPITSMMVMVDLLQEGNLTPEKQKEFLHNISRELDKMQWLIVTLLKIAKFDAGTVELRADQVNLPALVEDAVRPFLIQAELRGIHIELQTQRAFFEGDYPWTLEAVQNIIKNCLEHTGDGGLLKISCVQTALYTQLEIADNGCGIEKEDLPHIFERFYKGQNSAPGSVGIGLALSKSVFNRESAVVEVQSAPGKGTKFTIKFYRSIV